ncbi:putative protein kinase RLK-Pelle-LRR-IX family [Helianthus debilis subsp. tardiflorus]
MESGVICNKALDESGSEISVLTNVRKRHLVLLLGYSTQGLKRILVYEYIPQGELHRHLFHWNNFKLEPLSWKRRLSIALDVARGMKYLHSLAQQSFIHRYLKSSNILFSDDFRAKVSDFGPVNLVPDGVKSIMTEVAGTFGRDKRAGWKRLYFGMGQVKNFESRFYFHIFGYLYIQKIIKFKFWIPEFLDISDSDIGYFGSDFRIRIVLNTSNFHTTSLLIVAALVTPSASMVDYHRHTCTLILTITHIYTFLISIIFSTTDPNILNQLRKGLDLSNNNFSPPQPKCNPSMKLVLSGNPLFQSN